MTEHTETIGPQYAVVCEAVGHDRALLMHDQSFAQVIDEIVVPLEDGKPFFIDGVPLTKEKVRRLKILQQDPFFSKSLATLHWQLRAHSDVKLKQMLGEQYPIRFEALLRESAKDVTAQVMRAFSTEIKPRLRDYLPNRQELIGAALKVFTESVKLLGGAG